MTRVVVVDDQTLVRSGICSLLEVAGFEVVGAAEDGQAALEVLAATAPEVILLDLRMPRFDGLWTLEQLRRRAVEVPVLVLTTFDDDTLLLDALRWGARGYLLKDVTLEQLTHAIRVVVGGGTLVGPSLTARVLRAVATIPAPTGSVGPGVEALTRREVEVLRLLAEGCSTREIADVLVLAEGTVKNHVSSILLKLRARDRTNAVLRALREGILP